MFRFIILFAASMIVLCNNVKAIEDVNGEVRSTRSLSGDQDFNSLLEDSFGNIGYIISYLKSQIKDIVIDIGIEVFKFLRMILHEYKVKLFKRFAKYTLSDIFHFVFDGIFEFVGESYPDEDSLEKEMFPEPSNRDPNYAVPDPYFLEKLIRAEKK